MKRFLQYLKWMLLILLMINVNSGISQSSSIKYSDPNQITIVTASGLSLPSDLNVNNLDSLDYILLYDGSLLQVGGFVNVISENSQIFFENWFPLFPGDRFKGTLKPVLTKPSGPLLVVRMNVVINESSTTVICYLIDPASKKLYTISDAVLFFTLGNGLLNNPHFSVSAALKYSKTLHKMCSDGDLDSSNCEILKRQLEDDIFRGIDSNANFNLLMAMGKVSKQNIWKKKLIATNEERDDGLMYQVINYVEPQLSSGLSTNDGKLGLRLDVRKGYPYVVGLVVGGVAENSGNININDVVLGVFKGSEFLTFQNLSLKEVIEHLKGPAGSEAKLRIQRSNGNEEVVVLTRSGSSIDYVGSTNPSIYSNQNLTSGLDKSVNRVDSRVQSPANVNSKEQSPEIATQKTGALGISYSPSTGYMELYALPGTAGFTFGGWVPSFDGGDILYLDVGLLFRPNKKAFYFGPGFAFGTIYYDGSSENWVDFATMTWRTGLNTYVKPFYLGIGLHGYSVSSVRFMTNVGFAF